MDKVMIVGAFHPLGFECVRKWIDEGIPVLALPLTEAEEREREQKQLYFGRNANFHTINREEFVEQMKNSSFQIEWSGADVLVVGDVGELRECAFLKSDWTDLAINRWCSIINCAEHPLTDPSEMLTSLPGETHLFLTPNLYTLDGTFVKSGERIDGILEDALSVEEVANYVYEQFAVSTAKLTFLQSKTGKQARKWVASGNEADWSQWPPDHGDIEERGVVATINSSSSEEKRKNAFLQAYQSIRSQ
ncbi:hypothetical protein [Bacillus fonticola]|uniref:hypothetical protein n=1 Tax=Bacillus fonticola TaxID=2728853 RepID=UPI001475BAD3|nr:hypothetical protein [Bacillus fonticola]